MVFERSRFVSFFNKFFKKKEKAQVIQSRVLEEKWYTDKDYGPTRMQRREDGTVDFVWLEDENSPVGTKFSSLGKAKNFLKEMTPASFKENWSYTEEDIMWTESDSWEDT